MDEFESWIKEILPDYIEKWKVVEDGVINTEMTLNTALLFMGKDAAGVIVGNNIKKEMKALHLVARKNWRELADRLFHMSEDELHDLALRLTSLE